jgi:hypothetical protein
MARSLNPRLTVAASIATLAIAALAAYALADPGADDDGVFEIRMTDGAIELEAPTWRPGRGVIEVTNAGSEEHEIVVLRTRRAPNRLPLGLHGVSIRLAGRLVIGEDHVALGHRHRSGEILGLLPGESQRYQAELTRGHYVVYCQSGNHYLEGERTEFVVR